MAKAGERDEAKIAQGIKQAEYVKKGIYFFFFFFLSLFQVCQDANWDVEIEALYDDTPTSTLMTVY